MRSQVLQTVKLGCWEGAGAGRCSLSRWRPIGRGPVNGRMTSLGPKLHRAWLLVCLFLLLLLVQGVTPQSGDLNGNGRNQKEGKASPTGEGEELEEHFVASSVGEILQFLTMGHPQEEETEVEVETDESIAVRDHLFDLAFCFNLASILVFL